jgi:hypothetical protein
MKLHRDSHAAKIKLSSGSSSGHYSISGFSVMVRT